AHEQGHRGGIDSRPVSSACSVCFSVYFGGAFQKLYSPLSGRGRRGQILISSSEHAQGFFRRLGFVAQILKNRVGALRCSAAGQRQTLELPQSRILRPYRQSSGHNVVGEQRFPLGENAFAKAPKQRWRTRSFFRN